MYSEAELDAAVAEGAVSAEAVAALRDFVARRRATPTADEEQFRLLTGFNDIFVTIAAVLVLVAVHWLGDLASPAMGAAASAAASWGLAEYFTRRRRMALPSILLLASFVGGVFFAGYALTALFLAETLRLAFGAAAAAAGAALHWRRFHVPVTVAVGAVAAVGLAVALLLALVPKLADAWILLVFLGGAGLFALAMRWDMSDRARITRRSDVAFWLHLAAAPMIVHPSFALLGLLGHDRAHLGGAVVAVGLYAALALVALVVDRRALLVSALFYVLYAISTLINAAGGMSVSLALTAAVVGSALLLLSAFWHAARRAALAITPPSLRGHVPAA
jgi:hypothetical protein